MNQKTIAKSFTLVGKGIHTGNECEVTFELAPIDHGVLFIREDLEGKPGIEAIIENAVDVARGTILGIGDAKIHTVEHVLSALAGLGIYNIIIKIKGNEPPALDGSSKPYVDAILKAGIKELDKEQEFYKVEKVFTISDKDKKILLVPANTQRVSFTIEYDHPIINTQYINTDINPDVFCKEIMSARTFGFVSDYDRLKEKGQALGASLENTVALDKEKVINDELRYDDEFVRHKVLDVLGDLFLLGKPIKGHIIAFKTGHLENIKLVKKVKDEIIKDNSKVDWRIDKIKEILPHRHPFLLVDRIIEIVEGKKAVGYKNVTVNDSFFNGHFPQRPVMPGVLITEALAQVAGVFMLSQKEHLGKLPYFTGIDKVRFRRPVVPGDRLYLTVEILKIKGNVGKVFGKAEVDGKLAASGELMFSLVNAE